MGGNLILKEYEYLNLILNKEEPQIQEHGVSLYIRISCIKENLPL
jgi:hypothetical protein